MKIPGLGSTTGQSNIVEVSIDNAVVVEITGENQITQARTLGQCAGCAVGKRQVDI